jgi:uncharacterized surface protein with fasciclin (FAS1) repeats
MKTFLKALAVGALAVGVVACNGSSPASPSDAVPASPNGSSAGGNGAGAKPGPLTIVGIVAQPDGEFDVLQAAVAQAGLLDVLNGKGQYTVFAPTDQAFITTLNAGTEEAAIAAVKSLPIEQLTDILLYHVTQGRRISKSVLAAPQYTMLNGKILTREKLTAAGIAQTDISASNGVVHVINAVLMP